MAKRQHPKKMQPHVDDALQVNGARKVHRCDVWERSLLLLGSLVVQRHDPRSDFVWLGNTTKLDVFRRFKTLGWTMTLFMIWTVSTQMMPFRVVFRAIPRTWEKADHRFRVDSGLALLWLEYCTAATTPKYSCWMITLLHSMRALGRQYLKVAQRDLKEPNAAALLVTNDPSLPRRCDRAVLVGNVAGFSSCSTIVDAGTYDELITRGHNLRTISIY